MIQEGVNDPSIFKAVFLAGGPGSGKSFIVGKTALTALGMKVVNSDEHFERALAKAGLEASPENIYSPKGQEIRGAAKTLTKKQMENWVNGRLGLVIDGTGKDFDKIKKQSDMLKKLGYDTAMIFVNTDLDTAKSRNQQRARSLPDDQVEKMWKGVQNNLGKFQNYFGNQFFIVDNSEGSNYEGAILSVYRKISSWAKKVPSNSIAQTWIRSQKPVKEDSKQNAIDSALKALDKLYKSKGSLQSLGGYAYDISRSYNLGLSARELERLYKKEYDINEEVPGTSTTSVAGAGDDGIVAIDRRYRKDKMPRVLKRFRGFMRDSDA